MSALLFLLSLSFDLVRGASSTGVGDYVARGVGISSQSIAGTQAVSEGVLTVSGTAVTATLLENGNILVANQTVHPSSSATAAAASGSTGNGGAKNDTVEGCYSSWNEYWSASQASYLSSFSQDNIKTIPTSTWTVTGTNTYPGYAATTSTYVTTIKTENFVVNGGFTISTQDIDTTSTTVRTQSSYAGETDTYTNTITLYSSSTVEGAGKVPPKPTCRLPTVVPDCQNKWETWITSNLEPAPTPPPHCDVNAGFLQNTNSVPPCAKSYSAVEASYYSKYEGSDAVSAPLCTAASISGSLCQSVRDAYQMYNEFAPVIDMKTQSKYGEPFFFNQGTQGLFMGNGTKWIWPTSSTMHNAPSCTLGCGRCAVTGGTVQLIYWPATSTPTPSAAPTGSQNGTVKARATPPPVVTVETLGTTFTSPTLYISYKSLYASNACGTIGTEIGETILAIPPDKPLSSVYADTIPCDAHFRPTQVLTGTAPFTVDDLREPVPYSIYSSQPWCQTYLRNNGCTGTCPTTAPYKPILVVNDDLLRGLQADWSGCWGDIRGVYDPPLALTEAKTEDGPVNTFGAGPQATPATGPAPNTAAPTPSAAPDTDPSTTNGEAVPSAPKQSPSQDDPGKSKGPAPSPSDAQPTVVHVDPQPVSLSPVADPSKPVQVVNGDHTAILTPGAPAVTVGSQVMQAGSSGGIIVGTGHDASTIDPVQAPTAVSGISLAPVNDKPSAVQVVNGDHTAILTVGAPAVTVGSQIMQAASSGGIIVGTGHDASTIDPAHAPTAVNGISVSPVNADPSAIQVVQNGHTAVLTAGGPAVTVDGQIMSAQSSGGGVVVGTGHGVSTIEGVQVPTAATLHAAAYTMSELPGSASAVQIVEGGKTRTLTPGGSAMTIGSQILSAASSGRVVIGTGSSASTVDVLPSSSSSKSTSSTTHLSTTSSRTTSSERPSVTSAAATSPSSSNAASSRDLASSGAFVAALLFGVFAL